MDSSLESSIPIKYGPYAGSRLKPIPYNFNIINDPVDADIIVSVIAYLTGKVLTGKCRYNEIEGFDVKTNSWVVSAYQLHETPPSFKLAVMIDEFAKYPETRGCIGNITTNLEQWSKGPFQNEKVKGCLRVHICNPKVKSFSDDLVMYKPMNDVIILDPKDRSDKYLRANRSGIEKNKSRKPTRDEIGMVVAKKRNFVNKFVEYLMGITPTEIEQTVDSAFEESVSSSSHL